MGCPRAGEHRMGQLGGWCRPQDADQLRHRLDPVQPGQFDALHPPGPVQLGQASEQAEQQLEQSGLSGLVGQAGAVWFAQGRQEAGQLRPGGPTSSRTASTPTSLNRVRRISTIGAYGRAPSPTGTQPPASTRVPSVAQRATSSATRRVLPTPASPPTRTTAGSASAAALWPPRGSGTPRHGRRRWSSSRGPHLAAIIPRDRPERNGAVRGRRPKMGSHKAPAYGTCRIRGGRRSAILSWPATTNPRPGRWKKPAETQEGKDA
jgi:hypothetical protein